MVITQSEASKQRLTLAQNVLSVYFDNPRVKAVEVGASVARGYADQHSDVDACVFWSEPPTEEERMAAIESAGGVLASTLSDPDNGSWGESYYVAGIRADVGHRTIQSMEHMLNDVVDRHDSTLWKQGQLASFLVSVPLYGETLLDHWKAKAAQYPAELARTMVSEHLEFGPAWVLETLAKRQDLLFLKDLLVGASYKMVYVLSGLNGRYFPSPKSLERKLTHLAIAPRDLWPRLKNVFQADPVTGVRELQALIDETFTLVERHMPEIESAKARALFSEPAPAASKGSRMDPTQLAARVAAIYTKQPTVQAVILTGSVAQGYADQHSDVDLAIIWSEIPSDDERQHYAVRAGGTDRHTFPRLAETAIFEQYRIQGCRIDVTHDTVPTVERSLADVLARWEPSLAKQHVIAGLQHGIPLHGAALVEAWQRRVAAYPGALAQTMVQSNLDFGPRRTWLALVERDDFLFWHAWLCSELQTVLKVLTGLNRMYHPAHTWAVWRPTDKWNIWRPAIKWLDHYVTQMTIAPPNLSKRLRQILVVDPAMAAQLLHALVEETLALIETYMPEVDTKDARNRLYQPGQPTD